MSDTIATLLTRAADAERYTICERVAAINVASRLAAEQPSTVDLIWPDPPADYAWDGTPGAGGRLIRTTPSGIIPPLRIRPRLRWGVPYDDDEDKQPDDAVEPASLPVPMQAALAGVKMPRPGTGAATVMKLIMRPRGASLAELMQATGMGPRSVKGTISTYGRRVGSGAQFDGGRYYLFAANEPA